MRGSVQDLIADASNNILVSPASSWEVAIKVSLGKLHLNSPLADFLSLCLNDYKFEILPIEPSHAVALAGLPFPSDHKDPFDRLLVAQCQVEPIPLLSNDSALDAYPIRRMW